MCVLLFDMSTYIRQVTSGLMESIFAYTFNTHTHTHTHTHDICMYTYYVCDCISLSYLLPYPLISPPPPPPLPPHIPPPPLPASLSLILYPLVFFTGWTEMMVASSECSLKAAHTRSYTETCSVYGLSH